jgi:methyltransferase-like protein/SAM-dependent methyltransferase
MKTSGGARSLYDEFLYPVTTFPQTHPNRLATVAFLRGMQPAPVRHCRVLELGCGVGSNIIGMAFQLPTSEFIGLDLAQRPIASGQDFAKGLGMKNVTLYSMDICAPDINQLGQFDYIIAHGVYSWVAEPVRERILAICRERLNPQGVAYISYNAYPGNHLRDLVRGMMRFHTAQFEDPIDKVGQARGLLKFLADSSPKLDYYIAAIRSQLERTLKHTDEAFFHDDLSEVNQPFYFHEFISAAERHGLQFLGEARSNDLEAGKFTPQVMQRMNELGGAPEVVREQYKDFVRGCAFRETLLCRRELEIAPDLLVERITKLYASCDATAKEEEADVNGHPTLFRRKGGLEMQATHPMIGAALNELVSHWPVAVSFEALLGAALAATAGDLADETEILANTLASAYRIGFVELHISPPQLTNKVSERPAVSRLARYQLERGEWAVNQSHVLIKLPDSLSRRLVQLLDGTRDQEMLRRDLLDFVQSGRGALLENGVRIENIAEVEVILERRIREGLESLAREGMLVS